MQDIPKPQKIEILKQILKLTKKYFEEYQKKDELKNIEKQFNNLLV